MGSTSQGGFKSATSEKPSPTAAASSRRRASAAAAATTAIPCGACKFLRRKCTVGCVFAAHFASDQGAARFAAVHKVFGASNVSKLLSHLPPARRRDAVATICYEAQARLSDPVYGCVATVLALQQQVAALQAELSLVQAHLVNTRTAAVTVFQGPQDPHTIAAILSVTQSSTSDDDHPTAGAHRRHDMASFPAGTVQEEEGESGRNPIVFVEEIFQQK